MGATSSPITSYNDTGAGEYKLDIGCEGTDVQCMRANLDKPCEEGKTYIQGASIAEDQTWASCEVVVLEDVTVAPEATITINPGVEVKGNYLEGDGGAPFGEVRINVEGHLQAVGTEEAPVIFTNFVEEFGWGGAAPDEHGQHPQARLNRGRARSRAHRADGLGRDRPCRHGGHARAGQ